MSMIGNCRRLSQEQLDMLISDPSGVSAFLYEQECNPADQLDLDKAWHAIHFLLNGQEWTGTGPLFDAILGGQELGEEDVGYGPARFLTPQQVKATASALEAVPASELMARFDAAQFAEAQIYPAPWSGSQEDIDYIRQNFAMLVRFFRLAADHDQAMLLYIN